MGGGGVRFTIHPDDLTGEPTRALLALHLAGMHASSPPGHSFALDLTGLGAPGVTVWSAWASTDIASIGALKLLGGSAAEVKSMRTHPDFARQGAGSAILETVISAARAHGVGRLSLETGTGDAFEAALTLYRRRGFVEGGAFGDYVDSAFNRFFHLDLAG